ncbi:MAG: NAD(P)H-dependent oxidoreductase subunit E [Anaerolineales bacterium]
MNELQREYPEEIERILAKYPPENKRSAVMPLLYLAQRRQGYIPPQAIQEIAQILELSTTEVASVAGFYSLFHEQPEGRWRIQVCTDLPCALRGADEFLKRLCEALGVAVGGTTADGLFTVEEVKCLAACHRAPVFQLQGDGEIKYYESQSIDTVLALVEELRCKAESKKEGA